MYIVKRIGFSSAVKIAVVVSAAAAVVPIAVFLLLNQLFNIWDVIIPPEMIGEVLAAAAFWAAVWGGISTGLVVVIYNVCADFLGGIKIELEVQHPPRKQTGRVDID